MNKFFRKLKKVMIVFIVIASILILALWLFMQQDKFGASPTKDDRQKYEQLSNYKDGKFQNISPTPMLTPNYPCIRPSNYALYLGSAHLLG